MTTYLASLQTALHEAFAENPAVFLLGEDLLDPYGGAFKVSRGLSTAFPARVLTTPISEAGFTGVAAGMAMRGLRPIVEIMFGDFLTLCTDQLVNHITKFRGLYGSQVGMAMVIRTPMGGGRGYGATHSQSIEKLYLGLPELEVVAPSHAHDPGALLKHAVLHHDGPVLFVEHKQLYALPLLKPGPLHTRVVEEIPGFPSVEVANFSDGQPDVTVITYGGMSRLLVPLMERLIGEEIRVLAILPSSLAPLPAASLAAAAGRSGRVVVAEEGTSGFNWGSEVASCLYERLWGRLAVPVRRVASLAAAIPASRQGEERTLIDAAKLEAAILEVMA